MFAFSPNELYLYPEGGMYGGISDYTCLTITDNIYSLASQGRYAECVRAGLGQIGSVMQDEPIAQPMRIICNVLLALLGGMFVTLVYAGLTTMSDRPSRSEWRRELTVYTTINDLTSRYVRPSVSGTLGKAAINAAANAAASSSHGSSSGRSGGGSSGSSSHSGGGHSY